MPSQVKGFPLNGFLRLGAALLALGLAWGTLKADLLALDRRVGRIEGMVDKLLLRGR